MEETWIRHQHQREKRLFVEKKKKQLLPKNGKTIHTYSQNNFRGT